MVPKVLKIYLTENRKSQVRAAIIGPKGAVLDEILERIPIPLVDKQAHLPEWFFYEAEKYLKIPFHIRGQLNCLIIIEQLPDGKNLKEIYVEQIAWGDKRPSFEEFKQSVNDLFHNDQKICNLRYEGPKVITAPWQQDLGDRVAYISTLLSSRLK